MKTFLTKDASIYCTLSLTQMDKNEYAYKNKNWHT